MKTIPPDKLEVVLATDCGSTTTKAVLFEKTKDGWRQTYRGEAPTTVEKPVADVTIGARNAFLEVQELSGRNIVKSSSSEDEGLPPFVVRQENDASKGIDLYLSTSSAGGGLQMIVAGVVSNMTTQSAERAALGAGAIVMDSISIDDGREPFERVQKIRHLRPDIVIIAGGTDGGTVEHPIELAETLLQADPKPRFGETLKLPVIYAANKDAEPQVKELLDGHFEFVSAENLRPALDSENLGPSRDAVHELFLHHVMSHAPGYRKLLGWTPEPIMPTPAAVGQIVLGAAREWDMQILAVDIGGATTDVFSAFRADDDFSFNRTVSANLGMSYSVANVMLEAGVEQINRWLPFEVPEHDLRDRLRNKMIRPTSIPFTLEDLLVEQAVCREALRLAFHHHKRLAVGLSGVQQRRSIGEMFQQKQSDSLIDMLGLDLIIGSGGVLSHAPDRNGASFMLIDAYEPIGITNLAVDSIFMMPHLGVFSSIHQQAASEIFQRDCLVELGTCIAPLGNLKAGTPMLEVALDGDKPFKVSAGEIRLHPLEAGKEIDAQLKPCSRQINVGAGRGKVLRCKLKGGHSGLIIDCRGRPLAFPQDTGERISRVADWYKAFSLKTDKNGTSIHTST